MVEVLPIITSNNNAFLMLSPYWVVAHAAINNACEVGHHSEVYWFYVMSPTGRFNAYGNCVGCCTTRRDFPDFQTIEVGASSAANYSSPVSHHGEANPAGPLEERRTNRDNATKTTESTGSMLHRSSNQFLGGMRPLPGARTV